MTSRVGKDIEPPPILRQPSPSKLPRSDVCCESCPAVAVKPAVFVISLVVGLCLAASIEWRKLGLSVLQEKYFRGAQVETYAVVIDAGSTGSRVHVYCVTASTGELCSVGGKPEVFRSTTPGVSSCSNSTCLSSLLRPLLQSAVEAVPAKQRSRTPLAVRATAGVRLLPEAQAKQLLEDAHAICNASGFQDAGVEVMGGDEEGMFQWIAVNNLLGMLRPGVAPAIVLDLGGASTQMAYMVEPADVASMTTQERATYIRELHLPGRSSRVHIYQHSYLGFGLLAARAKMFEEAAAVGLSDACPCLLKSARVAYVYFGRAYRGLGSGDGTQCVELLKRILRPPTPCEEGSTGRCAFGGVWSGPGWKHQNASADEKTDRRRPPVVACSNFFYALEDAGTLSNDSTDHAEVTPLTYLALAKSACQMSPEEAAHSFAGVDATRAEWMCHDLSYLYALLTVGFLFEEDRDMMATKAISTRSGDSYAATWTLGLALEQIARASQRS